jgi:AAA ATPase-like protein
MGNRANPFTPHQPIDPIFFAGRADEVLKINSALQQTRYQKTQHVLLTGERGIGKTSLAIYARYLARSPNEAFKSDFRFATAYYSVERDQALSDICRGLTTKLLDGVEGGLAKSCFEKLKKLNLHFAIQVPGVGEIAIGNQSEGAVNESYLQSDFVKALEEFWEDAKETHNGILLIIDELHNLASFEGLGSFFKVVSESLAVDGYRQIMFMTIGLPAVSAKISDDDPSAPRIFSYVELRRMTQNESVAVLNTCLSGTGKTITEQAAYNIARNAGGFPYFLHQLGYDAFEVDTDNAIDENDAVAGLINSLVQFERMFFGKMYKSVEGKKKQKIVDELADQMNVPQTASHLEGSLKIKNAHQYLASLEKDGIVEKVNGNYKLSSDLLSIYVRLFKMLPRSQKQKLVEGAVKNGPK